MNPWYLLLVPLVLGAGLLGAFIDRRLKLRALRLEGLRWLESVHARPRDRQARVVRGTPLVVNDVKVGALKSAEMTFHTESRSEPGFAGRVTAVIRAEVISFVNGGDHGSLMEALFSGTPATVLIPMDGTFYRMTGATIASAKITSDNAGGMTSGIFEISGEVTRDKREAVEPEAAAAVSPRIERGSVVSASPVPA